MLIECSPKMFSLKHFQILIKRKENMFYKIPRHFQNVF